MSWMFGTIGVYLVMENFKKILRGIVLAVFIWCICMIWHLIVDDLINVLIGFIVSVLVLTFLYFLYWLFVKD